MHCLLQQTSCSCHLLLHICVLESSCGPTEALAELLFSAIAAGIAVATTDLHSDVLVLVLGLRTPSPLAFQAHGGCPSLLC